MNSHPLRDPVASGGGMQEFESLFSPDIIFYAPMFTKPFSGKEKTANLVRQVAKIVDEIEYTLEIKDTRQTYLFWNSKLKGRLLEAVTIVVYGEDGLISELRVLMRPWVVVTLFVEALHLPEEIKKEYLIPGPESDMARQATTTVALKPMNQAENMILHSPLSAKPIEGKVLIGLTSKMIQTFQGPVSFTAIMASPDTQIELFDTSVDGYYIEGLRISQLNKQGEIVEVKVLVRPWPVVALLRNQARTFADKTEELSFLTTDFWE